ncbi:uncharacterized protein LOC127789929 [Diospyros lotus]|uniref:uncharacterized protein LOC127789929 n=1 Tax=Diospyros lotus TaxID=55363 RepID=UPI00224CE0C9|nr:uncharacterized protein LOC127789929 [Diospyros lotus]
MSQQPHVQHMASNSFPLPCEIPTTQSFSNNKTAYSQIPTTHKATSTPPDLIHMTPTFIFSLFLSFCILLPFTDQTTGWLAIDKSILVLAGAFLLAVLAIVIAPRATVEAWITVLVLLAFAGTAAGCWLLREERSPLTLQCTWAGLWSKREVYWLLLVLQF